MDGGGRQVGNRAWRDSGVADEVEAAVIPLDPRLIERSKVAMMTAEQVLEVSAETVGTFRSDH